ncbi:MAG TPA: 50S ribosomal protein L24 [Nevskiaceae bacterium]|nr:50S ribosomal protein L24 [Nevskiaceae bacterium]
MKLKKDDRIVVIAGKDKGAKGKIEKMFPRLGKVLIPGINVYKKFVKSQGEGKPGGIVDIAKPLPVANVVLLCPKCGQKTRIGYRISKEGKNRICKKCQAVV